MRYLLCLFYISVFVSCSSTATEDKKVSNYSTQDDWIGCQLTSSEFEQIVQSFLENKTTDPEQLYCAYKRISIDKKRGQLETYLKVLDSNKDANNTLDSLFVVNPFDLDVLRAFSYKYYLLNDTVAARKKISQTRTLIKSMLHKGRGATLNNPVVITDINDVKTIIEYRFKAKVLNQKRMDNAQGIPCVLVELQNKQKGKFDLYYSMLPDFDLGSLSAE